jgi:hypothetical protein
VRKDQPNGCCWAVRPRPRPRVDEEHRADARARPVEATAGLDQVPGKRAPWPYDTGSEIHVGLPLNTQPNQLSDTGTGQVNARLLASPLSVDADALAELGHDSPPVRSRP